MIPLLRRLFGLAAPMPAPAMLPSPDVPRPAELFRRGRYFVVRLAPWCYVCRDDPEAEDGYQPLDRFALLSLALRECLERDRQEKGSPS